MLKKRNGQSVLEYVIIFTVVAAAVVAFVASSFTPSDNSKGLGRLLSNAGTKLTTESTTMVDQLK